MQSVSAQFNNHAGGMVRPISAKVTISFSKAFDDNVDFFTIGSSSIGGTDFIKGEGDVIQEWDKYDYIDYTSRLISVEWERELDPFSSTALAMADVVLDNHDGLFSADNFLRPYRPIRIYAGFGGEMIQVFVGLTEKAPKVDDKKKTVTYHCIDFLYQLFNRKIDRSIMLQDVRTDEVLEELLDQAGLLPTQYQLDYGQNVIPFAFFERDTTFGHAIRQLMVAEMGRFYLDENGITTFRSRQGFSQTPQWTFSPYNVNDFYISQEDNLINVATIKADVRKVQGTQNIGTLGQPLRFEPLETKEVWVDFQDPVTSADVPDAFSVSTSSFWLAYDNEDGTGTDRSLDLQVTFSYLFSKALLMTIANGSSSALYMTKMDVYGTPARVVDKVAVTEIDQDSIDQYEERIKEIENPYIQDIAAAQSKALMLLQDYADYGAISVMDVKGNMALQLGDYINQEVREITYVVQAGDTRAEIAATYGITETDIEAYNPWLSGQVQEGQLLYLGYENTLAMIDKISCMIGNGKFTQRLRTVEKTFIDYFTIGISDIGGEAVIAP